MPFAFRLNVVIKAKRKRVSLFFIIMVKLN
jgi:hypothetical protein